MKRHFLPTPAAASILLLSGLLLGWGAARLPSDPIPSVQAAEPGAPGELDQLLKARYQTASSLLDTEEKRLREGVTTLGHVCEVARWVRDSAVELPSSAADRLTALTHYVMLTRRLEESLDRATARGVAPFVDREAAHYLRLDAEVTLLRAKLSR